MSSHINSSTRIKDDDGPRDLPKPTVASAENPIPDQKPEKPAKLLNALNRVPSISMSSF
ncbi:hypothetical protein FRC02_004165 [Tulasnella sp. 418]|nr:hypothetical protein FRC02_004165 [Tulasnella sp. 418]